MHVSLQNMFKKIKQLYNSSLEKLKIEAFKEVILFFIITVVLHGLWRLWGNHFDYLVFGKDLAAPAFDFLAGLVRDWSAWVANHILGIETETRGEMLVHDSWERLGVVFSCSGLKQFYQFFFLMLLFPGPWKKKLWFIPLGIFALHLLNVFRIVVLYVIIIYKYSWFTFTHDWILRPLFYVLMFMLWVWWVERLAKSPKSTLESSE